MSDERLRELERRFRADSSNLDLALQLANERARAGRPRPPTSWERAQYFARVGPREVVVGESGRSRFEDAAGSARHAAFLAGMYQDLVLANFGPEALLEMIEAVVRAPELFAAENAALAQRQRHLAAIPYDPSLGRAALVEGQVWWAGTRRLTVPSDTRALEVTSVFGGIEVELVEHGTGRRRPVSGFVGGIRAAVGIADRFYVANDGYLIVEPTGEVHLPPDAGLFGGDLRLDRVARLGDSAVFHYWWLDRALGEPGWLRWEHGRGWVARCEG